MERVVLPPLNSHLNESLQSDTRTSYLVTRKLQNHMLMYSNSGPNKVCVRTICHPVPR